MKTIAITYTERPPLEGFSIVVPPGHYTREHLIDLMAFEYQWQCDEAKTTTVVINRPSTD
jgi:hypothetical protein